MSDTSSKYSIWIFCTIIDNFGDIGIAHRIAKELSQDPQYKIYLFVDDLTILSSLDLKINNALNYQTINNIEIFHWQETEFPKPNEPLIVLELFGCFSEKPCHYIFPQNTLFINIEYLSSEEWTKSCHLKPSLQQDKTKFFYFLGFDESSGGLLREKNYQIQRNTFLKDKNLQNQFIKKYNLPELPENSDKKVFLLFGYESPIWCQWIKIWNTLNIDYQLWFAGNQVFKSITDQELLTTVDYVCLPFVEQIDFDKLLWAADFAVVRGEDSFVRAQLAGVPFIWHIYPQQEEIHHRKLQAFWQMPKLINNPLIFNSHQLLSNSLNEVADYSLAEQQKAWKIFLSHYHCWQQSLSEWQHFLFSQPSAFEKLTQFIKKQLK